MLLEVRDDCREAGGMPQVRYLTALLELIMTYHYNYYHCTIDT